MFQPRTLLVCERKCTPYLSLKRGSLVTVADPRGGPGEATPKKFWGVTGPPYLRVWMTTPPPPLPSKGLDLALFHTYLKN